MLDNLLSTLFLKYLIKQIENVFMEKYSHWVPKAKIEAGILYVYYIILWYIVYYCRSKLIRDNQLRIAVNGKC